MCNPASFVITKGPKVWWSKKSDSHIEIVDEHKLNADGIRGPNIVNVEVSPPNGNISLPLSKWQYKVDQAEVPKWYDETACKKACRMELKKWSKYKLTGWKVKEAFNPVNPLLIKRKPKSKKELQLLLQKWDSVGASVWDSVRASVGDSVGDSVGAYIAGLFPNIKTWEHAEKLGSCPWKPLLELWYAGYLPSYDGVTWRLHTGKEAKVVLEWKPNN